MPAVSHRCLAHVASLRKSLLCKCSTEIAGVSTCGTPGAVHTSNQQGPLQRGQTLADCRGNTHGTTHISSQMGAKRSNKHICGYSNVRRVSLVTGCAARQMRHDPRAETHATDRGKDQRRGDLVLCIKSTRMEPRRSLRTADHPLHRFRTSSIESTPSPDLSRTSNCAR